MNQLEALACNGVIELHMSEPAFREARNGNNTDRTAKAMENIISPTFANTNEEQTKLRKICEILFPNGAKDKNQQNDIEIVFNAGKYCYVLVTNDGGSKSQPGGILGNAQRLKKELNIEIMSDIQTVKLVKRRIEDRDALCKYVANENNQQIPAWVGQD